MTLMPMHDPPHPGEHIRMNCLERLHLGLAARLERVFGGTARHWLQLQLNHNLWQAEHPAARRDAPMPETPDGCDSRGKT